MWLTKIVIEIVCIAVAIYSMRLSRIVVIDYIENIDNNTFRVVFFLHLFFMGVYYLGCKPLIYPQIALILIFLQLIFGAWILKDKERFLLLYKRFFKGFDFLVCLFYAGYFFTNLISFMFR